MAYTASQLLTFSEQQLDDLFRASPPGKVPDGEAQGTAILAPGTPYTPEIASIVNIFAWQGKTFDAARGTLVNRISAFGVDAIVAEVYEASSWFDEKQCIVLDYSRTSLLAKHIRDEIREISPGVFLGLVYWEQRRTIHFALEFPAQ